MATPPSPILASSKSYSVLHSTANQGINACFRPLIRSSVSSSLPDVQLVAGKLPAEEDRKNTDQFSYLERDSQPKPSKKPISLSEFLNRKVGKTSSSRLLQEKTNSIGSIGFERKNLEHKKNEVGNGLMLEGVIFQQFSRAIKGKDAINLRDGSDSVEVGARSIEDELLCSSKRRKPNEFSSGDAAGNKKHLVVLGDDPQPRLRKEHKPLHKNAHTAYNHYANGRGWWDSDKEGIDNEEVGHFDSWEALGSTTLGGLEWH